MTTGMNSPEGAMKFSEMLENLNTTSKNERTKSLFNDPDDLSQFSNPPFSPDKVLDVDKEIKGKMDENNMNILLTLMRYKMGLKRYNKEG